MTSTSGALLARSRGGEADRPEVRMTRRKISLHELREIFLRYPGVREGTSYGTTAFRFRKRLLARMHPAEPAVILRVADTEEQKALIDERPNVFYLTDHYEGYPWVLARLRKRGESQIVHVFEKAWRNAAPQRLLAEFDRKV